MAVEAALRRAVALWGRLKPTEHANGAIIFCSEDVAEAVHPLQPLQCRLYSCGKRFRTDMLHEQLEVEKSPAYGIIVIDGSDAMIGTAQGLGVASAHSSVCRLAHLQSNTASQTRRGGQSALRYSRLRDGEDLAFCRRVAERAALLLGGVRGLVLAGKADAKHRLRAELPQPLRGKVLCVINLSCSASTEGLRQAASRATDAAGAEHRGKTDDVVRSFMESTAMPDPPAGITCCYGVQQTAAALALGAVDVLLVAADWSDPTPTKDDWRALAETHRTRLVEVEDRTQDGAQFCHAFRVAGCLRWPVDPELLEESGEPEPSGAGAPVAGLQVDAEAAADPAARSSGEELVGAAAAAAAAGSCGGRGLADWLPGALLAALGDESAAEALVSCVEVVLGDDQADPGEALEQAAAMLAGEGVPQPVVDEMVARAG